MSTTEIAVQVPATEAVVATPVTFAVGDVVTVKVTHTAEQTVEDAEGNESVEYVKTHEVVTATITELFPEVTGGYSVRRTGRTIAAVVTEAGKARDYRTDRLRHA